MYTRHTRLPILAGLAALALSAGPAHAADRTDKAEKAGAGTVTAAGAVTEKAAPTVAADRTAALKESPGRLLTLDYVNAEVVDVVRALSAQSGVNVALNPNVKGQVTVHLRGKTVDEAMAVVANLAGLGAKKVKDTFVVAPRAEMKPTLERLGDTRTLMVAHIAPKDAAALAEANFPDLTARPQGKAVALTGANDDLDGAALLIHQNDVVVPGEERAVEKVALGHIPASEATAAITKMVPGVEAEAAGSAVVLTGHKRDVDAARAGLAMIDVQARPDTETRVYNIKYVPAAQLINLVQRAVPDVDAFPGPESYSVPRPAFNPISSQFAGFNAANTQTNTQSTMTPGSPGSQMSQPMDIPGSSGATKGMMAGNALSILLRGNPAALDQAMQVLNLMDVAPRQVVIEAKVVETTKSLQSDIGVNWSWTPFSFYELPAGSAVSQSSSGSTGSGGGTTSSTQSSVTRPLGFGAFSRAPWSFQATLQAAINKGDAKLLANPSITAINDQDASIFIGDTLRFQSLAQSSPTTGNQFTVVEVPVGIILLVHPRVNDDGNVTLRVHPVVSSLTGITNGLPQTASREAETQVRVKDGDTLVIGGLIQDTDIKNLQKVPFLGDLPILGYLFRSYSRTHNRNEITVVLTIHVQK